MNKWCIEVLSSTHNRGEFCCGKTPLDEFLRLYAGQYQKKNVGQTYVAVQPDDNRVYGYYTLASGAIRFENLPLQAAKKLPKHPVPTAVLGRLAVDLSARGQRLGEFLLVDALRKCAQISNQMGIHAVEVHAIDKEAAAFYSKYGFQALPDDPLHFYVSVKTILKLFS